MKQNYLRHLLIWTGILLFGSITMAQPVVNSSYRYVRGSTMALVRMTYSSNGASVVERGVCVSESETPTVNDIKANQSTQLTNKGPIYWLKDLKPATKYYMRGYVITNAGQTVYGEVKKFYTIPKGQITFSMRTSGDSDSERIRVAAQTAIDWWNTFTEMKGFAPSIGFNSGVPTAECSYGGWMSVGSNQSYQRCGTIMHEMLHGVGVIPWADTEWSRHNLRSGVNGDGYGTGLWLGDRVTEVLTFLENTETHLNGDYQHMWPYGINGASEDNGSDLLYIGNSAVCQALGEDGLQHTSSCFAQPYYALEQEDTTKFYIKNESIDRGRYSSFLIVSPDGSLKLKEMTIEQALANDSAAWTTTFTPRNQFYQIRNVATGRYITYTGSIFTTVERTTATANENLQLMKGRVDVDGHRGYWLIQPASNWTPKCINAYANGNINAQAFNIANNAESQRWLMLEANQMNEFEKSGIANKQKALSALLIQIKALQAIPHTESIPGADAEFTAAISNIEKRSDEATSVAQMITINTDALKASIAFLSKVKATNINRPFNITYMMTNPGIDTNTDGWSQSATVNHSCAEFYENTFDFNQTITDVPTGLYKATVQGFQRPGSYSQAYSDYASGHNNVTASFYLNDATVLLQHIAKGVRTSKLGGVEAEVGSGLYIPDNMEAASKYFAKNQYNNEIFANLQQGDSFLKLGLKSETMSSRYWVIFDNFNLYFYGNTTKEELLSINTVNTDNKNGQQSVYTLDGRQMSPSVQLRPGLYIVNKKKVIVR